MSILLETTFGDLTVDLDIEGSPALAKNILKLAKARYYTNTLIYNVVPGKYCQMGDPSGDGTGGCSIYGLIDSYQSSNSSTETNNAISPPPDVTKSQRRFLQSHGRHLSPSELDRKGVLIAMEIGNVPHTIGSQFLITLSDDNGLKDLVSLDSEGGANNATNNAAEETGGLKRNPRYLSLGIISEDSQRVLSKMNRAYCDDDGRPFADIRIQRALVIHDPFEDPAGMNDLLQWRGVKINATKSSQGDEGVVNGVSSQEDLLEGYPLAPQSPSYERPPEETVAIRIQADDTTLFANAGWDDDKNNERSDDEDEEDEEARQKRLELQQKQEEEWRKRQDSSRAVMLEMLGDLPSADIQAPENVLFVCKLNPITNDEDLELIFSRFDQNAKAEIIRDPDSGTSLQYAFVEFTSNESCNEAYLKMNNALVDDRRIRVDFSQSVAKVWDRYHKRYRKGLGDGVDRGFMDGSGRGRGAGRGRGGRGGGGGRGFGDRGRMQHQFNQPSTNRPASNRWDNRSSEYNDNRKTTGQITTNNRDSFRDPNRKMGRMKEVRDSQRGGFNPKDSRDRDGQRCSDSIESRNRYHSGHSRSRSPSRDERRRSRSRSRNRQRQSRSKSGSRDRSQRKKRHRKDRHRDRKDRSRSNERDRKKKKKHSHSSHRHHHSEDERDKRHRKHHRRHRNDKSDASEDDHHSRCEQRKHHRQSDRSKNDDHHRRPKEDSRTC